MILKIPVYFQVKYYGKTSEKDVDLLKIILQDEIENFLDEKVFSLVDEGFFFKADDRIEAKHKTISDVHEILRTKR